ncbi:MAG: SDR family oxidoreductase [Cyclobacteriaceae bacterium]|nr:SDR family oxidoreductase [Cyclobacteriaceae bacterium]
MNLEIKGHVVIVTGGAKGIGESIVKGVAEEGGIPVIVNRPGPAGPALEKELSAQGADCLFIEAELAKVADCERVINTAVEKYGRIDALVNNAGKNDGVSLTKGSPEKFMKSLENNLLHYYTLAQLALPYLKKAKGSIVNISSKTAVTGQGGTSAYIAAKGAQLALTREWAVELINDSIRVNAILPAEVWTPLYENWINSLEDPEGTLKKITNQIPLEKRMTTSKEIADAALFLISARASHITGQHWYVDGGYTHLDRALGNINL